MVTKDGLCLLNCHICVVKLKPTQILSKSQANTIQKKKRFRNISNICLLKKKEKKKKLDFSCLLLPAQWFGTDSVQPMMSNLEVPTSFKLTECKINLLINSFS